MIAYYQISIEHNKIQRTFFRQPFSNQRRFFSLTDCMVLIRKILQYHPSQRPTIVEILEDPWLTGKKPIPRQTNRPKWVVSISGLLEVQYYMWFWSVFRKHGCYSTYHYFLHDLNRSSLHI